MYKDNEYCMEFSNEEIIEFLVKPLRECPQFDILQRTENDEFIEVEENPAQEIRIIVFDGKKDSFFVYFCGNETRIWIGDEDYAFGKYFMFIDDKAYESYSEQDTQGDIAYEGKLRDKTHEEILILVKEFVLILAGTQKMEVEATRINQSGTKYSEWKYPKYAEYYEYIIKLENPTAEAREVTFENIKFIINGG